MYMLEIPLQSRGIRLYENEVLQLDVQRSHEVVSDVTPLAEV